MTLPPYRCACGSLEVVAFDPGSEPVTAPGGIVIDSGRVASARCLRCWPAAKGTDATQEV